MFTHSTEEEELSSSEEEEELFDLLCFWELELELISVGFDDEEDDGIVSLCLHNAKSQLCA